jgi:hypothetical protein
VLLRELFLSEAEIAPVKQLGRTFNHLEDLAFLHNSAGAIEALDHLKEITAGKGEQLRLKWDGSPQVYWGRDEQGAFTLAGHNQWLRKVKASTPEQVQDFISNQSGNPKTPEEKAERDQFAQHFSSLWPLFEAATPAKFRGYVYADALFLSRPEIDANSVYNFHPNPKSKTVYHVNSGSDLGHRIGQAEVMVVGHGTFDVFGAPDNTQQPKASFEEFNSNPQLIVMGPEYVTTKTKVDTQEIDRVEADIKQSAGVIDSFLAIASTPGAGLSNLKEGVLYPFVNWAAKSRQLDNLSSDLFYSWLAQQDTKKVSQPKKDKISSPHYTPALDSIFRIVLEIMTLKEHVMLQAAAGASGDVWATNGEGHVRYKSQHHQFSHVKFVPRRDIQTPNGSIPAWTP